MAVIGIVVLLGAGLWLASPWWGVGPLQATGGEQALAVPPASPAAILVVTSTANSGYGTLRWAMQNAGSGDTITFDPITFPPASPVTVTLASALPDITQGNLTIDGSNAGVILDGSSTPADTGGLRITSSGNVVRGLQIIRFPGQGVEISGGAQNNTIGGNRLVGSGPLGQGNLISGNNPHGITIQGSGTMSNTVIGNYIGTNVSGTAKFGNALDGVKIEAPYNQVGGATPGERNLISGNGDNEVRLTGSDAQNNAVRGNLIGTDATGTIALGNASSGVLLADDAQNNTIGGTTANERNVISGNGGGGIDIGIQKIGPAAHHNLVIGNYIGTNISGTAAIGNGVGVQVCAGAADNTIGGSTAGERNVIAGSRKSGVHLCDGAVRNRIIGNYLGTDASGTIGLGNEDGVDIDSASQQNTIGPGNLIAYNGDGVWINGTTSLSNTVTQNSIHSNNGQGIVNVNGGNRELPPPVITRVTDSNIVTGTACAGCTVEVFSDFQDEGRGYEGSTIADGSGNFSLNKPTGFTGPNLTATATDAGGNTSEFSSPVTARYFLYLPLVLKIYGGP